MEISTARPAYPRIQHLVPVLFYAICALAWIPRISSIGSSVVGLSAVLIIVSVPIIFLSHRQIVLDDGALRYRLFLFLAMSLLLIWGYIRIFDIEHLLRSGRFFLSIGQGFVIVTIISTLLTRRQLSTSFRILVVMMFVSIIASILAGTNSQLHNLIYQDTDRAHGFFKNSNQFGMMLSMCVPMCVVFLLFSGKRLLPLIGLFLVFFGLALAGSKTNLVIAVLLLFLSLTYSLVVKKRIFQLMFLLPLIIVLVSYTALPILNHVNPRAARIITAVILENPKGPTNARSVNQRVELWKYSINVMVNNPYLGEGTSQRIVTPTQDLSHSHNVFLDVGRTIGVPGLIGIVILIGSSVLFAVSTLVSIAPAITDPRYNAFSKSLLAGACFGVISYVLSNQMSDSFGPSTSPFFWFAVGVMLRRNDLLQHDFNRT